MNDGGFWLNHNLVLSHWYWTLFTARDGKHVLRDLLGANVTQPAQGVELSCEYWADAMVTEEVFGIVEVLHKRTLQTLFYHDLLVYACMV